MKILMVCPDWFPYSAGLAQSCYETCKELINHGHQVRVIVAKDDELDNKGLDVYPVKYLFRLLGINPIVINLYKKIKHHVIWCDIVSVFSYMYEMNSRIALLKKIKKIKKPLVHFYRGSLESNFLFKMPVTTRLAKNVYDSIFGRLLFKIPDLVISNSEPTIQLMHKRYHPKNRIIYVNNAHYSKKFPEWKKENKRILFIGRYVINKGIEFFPKILDVIPSSWIFTTIGGGPLQKNVETLKLQYSNLEVLEKLPHEDLMKLMANSDILVLPTFAEGAPRAVMEASAVGIPSICFKVGDVQNLIPENCGYAIEPYEIDDFCLKLRNLIQDSKKRQEMGKKLRNLIQDSKKRQEMGKNARELAQTVFDWKNVYPKIERALESLLE